MEENKSHFINAPKLWFADLETFTVDSEYFKRNAVYDIKTHELDISKCKTKMYIYSLCEVPCSFHSKNKGTWCLFKNLQNFDKKIKYGVTFEELFKHIYYDGNKCRYRLNNVLYFHNGMNFDNYFLLYWIKESNLFKYITDNKIEPKKYQYNFFTANISDGYFSLTLYFWIDKIKKHCRVVINDSRKLIMGSVADISKQYALGIYKDRILQDFGNLDLNKKPLDINYITDIDDDYWYTNTNKKIPLKILNTSQWYNNEDIKMIKERVGNDSLIMCIVLAYLIVDGVISDIHSQRIYATMGSVSCMKFAKNYIEENDITEKDDKDPKVFWNKYIFKVDNEQKQKINEFFYPWCHGGFCSLNQDYIDKEIKDNNLKSYDVCSLYPSVCAFNDLPYGPFKTLNKEPKNQNKKFIFVYFECTKIKQLVTNCCNMIPLWFNSEITPEQKKNKYHSLHYVRELDGNLKCYDILQTCKDVWWNNKYFKIENLKNIKYYMFDADCYLKSFMLKNYELKKNAKSEVQKLGAKLILNSLTGKFGQKELKETGLDFYSVVRDNTLEQILKEFNLLNNNNNTIEVLKERYKDANVDDNSKLMILKEMIAPHSFYPTYAAITALGRYKTMKTQLDICYNNKDSLIVYSDTDSMKGNATLPDNLVTKNKELGKWSEEWNNNALYMKVLRPKVWGCATADKKLYKVATGGVNPNKLISYLKTIDNFNLDAEIPGSITHHIIGGKVIIDINKKISRVSIGR